MRKIILAAASTAFTSAFASTPPLAPSGDAAPVAAKAPAAPRVDPKVTGVFTLASIPERKAGGRGASSPYTFDALEVNQAFGVQNKDKRGMSSIVSNANKKHRSQGTGADGQPVTIQTKQFAAFDVDAELKKQIKGTPLEGSTVLVVRTK